MAYEVNYDDQRFKEVESDKKAAISEIEKTYSGMANESDKYYQAQINASKEWEKNQSQLQQEKTDFAIEKIEQEKAQAKKDYTKEQSGAYVDWQKEKNRYGANAEQMAASGLFNDGYSESSQVSIYNTYQNRVMTARESYTNAVLNYNNAIKDARLQNNSVLAEIAYKALQQQLELSLAGFQYKNQLLLEKTAKKTEADQIYHQRYQDVLSQINTENALSEQIRQFNEQMALEREQFEWQKDQSKSGSSGGGYRGGGDDDDTQIEKGKTGGAAIKGATTGGAGIKKSSSESSNAEISARGVLDLGKGPRSGTWLEQQVHDGNVVLEQQGKLLVPKKTGKTNGMASKYLNLTGFGR